VAGNRGHIAPGIFLQFADAAFPIQKHLHDHQTDGMPQCLEYTGKRYQILDGGSRERRMCTGAIRHKRWIHYFEKYKNVNLFFVTSMARRANTVSYGNSLENYPHAGQVNSLPICSLAYFPATAMPYIGCHLSSAKGYEAMGRVALSIGANTFQFFTRNPRGSKAKTIDEQDIARFLELARNNGFGTLLAHAPYTLNPCSADPGVARFAAQVLKEDLELMEHLPGNLYNFHPGCHVGQGAEKGIELVANQLNGVLSPEQKTIVLLETMSGKGSEVGRTFEELAAIMERVDLKGKLGVCLDTCHVYSAGYDIVNRLDSVLEHFDAVLGLECLRAIHLNDSMTPFSSFKDRHETIGKGSLGEQAFINIINHPVLRELPFFLETPRDDAGHGEEITWLKEHYRN
jgi:deoxyribonuclease-4